MSRIDKTYPIIRPDNETSWWANQTEMRVAKSCTVDMGAIGLQESSRRSLPRFASTRPKAQMADAPIPNVVAMLICDQIIAEEGTKKKSLIGVFDKFASLSFPIFFQRLSVYVKLADAVGDYLFKLRFVKLKDESLIAEMGIQARIADASQYSELAVSMGNLPIPEPGKYEIQLYAGDVYLHRITMLAVLAQLQQGGPSWPQHK